ncbi:MULTISPECIES: argininosuccinate lyase [unclassified Clostridioides]|uniref:argininosuccinate lyase n=1 Tax=unclassified Clostridioides TaxID=2635829 RepID=UPI001D0CC4F2|nr:argininosuccinate lyase [Clostridioides sp. ES-S-0001-02]MCC0639225.1 argininosuccinate lyase [Clostridioides sp. ES-S-0049-03]MCC0652966.1 argininosuccinate lyase [Clostridioides sp. ES-S-0001-03]MCC0657050.1 argininosuccinate lyase [Clostridioides sp. ES-S-0123-01]MCC0675615.1 argininosuccinate lyase [Clostridioides sp. ES-W-0018-02]MCC0680234.1 argininosuccinate lyase [Clostridioides sp. ES-S-0005-03]MCC0701719.1 argininosuccinate lyase [Clostridioides sp. ES-S-0049-02]MCC0707582.1 arg
MKLWGGRFRKAENQLMEEFNKSFGYDCILYKKDIEGSIAHVYMQVKCGLLTDEEGKAITEGLNGILEDIENGKLALDGDYEDIHSFTEINLIQRIGDVGKKLHTARSRNDQVAVDMRLYAKEKASDLVGLISGFKETIKDVADKNSVMMPGYTHLQRAQVVTFKHHLMAYYSMFDRDEKRIKNAIEILDESPLGCGALAGTTHDIDRNITCEQLGFKKVVDNFMDGVSDRDYLLELMSDFSIIMMHLSRLSEELILWSSQEFGFVEIDDLYTTGSSIMPQKKNPDGAELIRGKTGRVYGNLFGLFTVMKGIPLAYNKDMQEDKEGFFDSVHTLEMCIQIMERMIATLKVNEDKMKQAVKNGFLNATEVADYLVKNNVAFRDAHGIVGSIVIYCEDNKKAIEDLTLEELHKFSDEFKEDIYDFINYESILNKGIKKNLK